MNAATQKISKATFGAGCFWHTEEDFRVIPGVIATAVGFMGGHKHNPTYEEVCRHDTGHAEVVQIDYDADQVSYQDLLNIFWTHHNPTTLNRQGPDIGEQYRSVIFYHSPEQKQIAEDSRAEWDNSGRFKQPIVTIIEEASEFYPADEYHQKYLQKRGLKSCHI